MPLKGYSENSEEYNENPGITFTDTVLVAGVASIVGVAIIVAVITYIKMTYNEAVCVNKAREFHSTNAPQDPGQAFAKYQEYLSEIDTFLTKNPYHNGFRKDLISVFDMSQDDSRLTLSEKQKIVDKFASKKEFPTEPKKLKTSWDEWAERFRK